MSTRKNTMYNIAYRVFSVLIPLITAPYLARVCGQHGVGIYSYAWNINYFFCLIAMLGLENYGVRAIASARANCSELNKVFSGIWKMQRLVCFSVLVVWLGYIFLIANEERSIAISLIWMLISCFFNLDWALMGFDEFKPIALKNTCTKLIATLCVFLFIHQEEDLWIYGLVWSLATFWGCLLSAWSLRKHVTIVQVSTTDALKHLKPCAFLFISVLAVSIYRIMDKVMVGAIAGMSENGLYENAEKIVYCLSGFISAVGTVMLPKITRMWKMGKEQAVRDHMDLSIHLIMCMVCALAFGLSSVACELSTLFYGESFSYSGVLMIPLAFTLLMIGFANVIRTQWILPQSRDRIVIKSVSAGAIVNLVADSLLIPLYGAMGAVAGTLLAECTVPFVQFFILRSELPYRRYFNYVLCYSLIGAIMLLIVRIAMAALPLNGWARLIACIIIGACSYILLCLAFWHVSHHPKLPMILLQRSNKSKKYNS